MRRKAVQWLPLGDEEVFAPASDIVTYSGHISHIHIGHIIYCFMSVSEKVFWSLSLIRTNDNTWIVELPLQSTGPNHSVDVMLQV